MARCLYQAVAIHQYGQLPRSDSTVCSAKEISKECSTTAPMAPTNVDTSERYTPPTEAPLGYSVLLHHALFALWGICLVGFHLQSQNVAKTTSLRDSQGCILSSQPWFVAKFSCSLLEINCYRRGFTGDAHEIASALAHVDPNGVVALIITHCPLLHVPPELQTLKNLMSLDIFNVTLVDWDDHAALVNRKLPALQFLNLFRVNMSALPRGLQSLDFPTRLRDISFAYSNITTFPTDLHTKWKRMVNLVIEHTMIEVIPSTIAHLNPSRLSLLDNRITRIPDDIFTLNARFWIFSIAKNPISVWPLTIGSMDHIYLVLMDYTEISELPQWLIAEGERRAHSKTTSLSLTVSAGGSLFCRQQHSQGKNVYVGLHVVCREKADIEIEAYMAEFYQP